MSEGSDPVLGSVKLEVEAGYDNLWGKTKDVRTIDEDYDAALQMLILMIILIMMIAKDSRTSFHLMTGLQICACSSSQRC